MDWYFNLANSCRFTEAAKHPWHLDQQVYSDFAALREAFLTRFDDLAVSKPSTEEALASILALTHLELIFMAQQFSLMLFEKLDRDFYAKKLKDYPQIISVIGTLANETPKQTGSGGPAKKLS